MTLLWRQIKYYSSLFPLRRNGWVLLAVLFAATIFLNQYDSLESDRASVQMILSLITIAIAVALLLFGLLTAVPPYLLSLFRKRYLNSDDNHTNWPELLLEPGPDPSRTAMTVTAPGAVRPWFGFLYARLIFDDYSSSDDTLLQRSLSRPSMKRVLSAKTTIALPNIRDYRFRAVFLFFEDIFHFFAFPYRQMIDTGVYTRPESHQDEAIEVESRKSDEPVQRVVNQKTAQGDFLDYKKYAPGDDIRRIIWSNYARTGELTIRIPDETMPYVSKIRLLASFYDGSPGNGDLEFKRYLLDIYKEKLRQVIDTLREQEFEVSLLLDQEVAGNYPISDPYERMIYQLSAARWQSVREPGSFTIDSSHKLSGATTVVAFSTLCPSSAIENLRNLFRMDLNLCHYDVRRSLDQIQRPALLKRLFVINAFEPFDLARRKQEARGAVKFVDVNGAQLHQQLKNTKLAVIEV